MMMSSSGDPGTFLHLFELDQASFDVVCSGCIMEVLEGLNSFEHVFLVQFALKV